MNRPVRNQFAALLCTLFFGATAYGQGFEVTRSGAAQAGPEFLVMGFGDVGYFSRDGSSEDGFYIGQAVAHLGASMGDSFSVFGEFSATARDGDHHFGVERLIVKYDFSDHFKLSAGRYHTPIGYWNAAYHHGAWLQTTVSRPEMARFGSKILPIHFVGALLEGNVPSGRLGLDYKVGIGNGRHSSLSGSGDDGDINSDKAWMVQLNSKPRRWNALKVGIGYYADEVPLPDGTDVEESTVSAYAVWTKESPEVIVEYLRSTHKLVTDSSVSGNVDAWFAQVGYRLTGTRSKWKPYARVERIRVDDSDPMLGAEGLDYEGGILGVRWDFNSYAAIKAEYRNEEFDNGGRENNFRVQVSFVLTNL